MKKDRKTKKKQEKDVVEKGDALENKENISGTKKTEKRVSKVVSAGVLKDKKTEEVRDRNVLKAAPESTEVDGNIMVKVEKRKKKKVISICFFSI